MEVDNKCLVVGPSWAWKLTLRRKRPEDPFFEEGNIVCNLAYKQLSVVQNLTLPKRVPEFPCHVSRCHQVFSTVTAYEVHYSTVHRNVCSQCRRSFPTSHLLDVHLLEWHDTMFQLMAAKQKMYQCLVQECPEKFNSSKERKDHVIKVHHYPSNFRFDRSVKQRPKKTIVAAENSMETDSWVEDRERVTATKNASSPSQSSTVECRQNMYTSEGQSRKFVYKVPHNICFGHGASRGFQRPRSQGKKRGKKKHWHQQGAPPETDTTVSIEEVSMTDLAVALDNTNS